MGTAVVRRPSESSDVLAAASTVGMFNKYNGRGHSMPTGTDDPFDSVVGITWSPITVTVTLEATSAINLQRTSYRVYRLMAAEENGALR